MKKKAAKKDPPYEYIRAIRDAEGNLRWEYKVKGGPPNSMSHDEDVSEWSNRDIIDLTRSILCAGPDEKVELVDE